MENLNKKDLDIQAAVLNLSCMQEQVLASYRRCGPRPLWLW